MYIQKIDNHYHLKIELKEKMYLYCAKRINAEFSVLFSVVTSINRTNIRFISYHIIFNAFQDSKHSYKPLLNAGLF